ncbi:cytochrome d ubiquinol oxidase subunit II [candidate division KSB1 bacterium]
MDLNITWFILVGVLLAGYAILDGFDLGVGALHLFTKKDEDRRIMLNAIGPVWDGNEVWLITGGGALFAAFPHVYATVFSGFYTAFMLLLAVLIFRAVSIEFRSKQTMPWWRQMWDVFFALLAGVALGNIAWGVPVGPDMEYAGSFLGLLHPYALLVGITTVALFMMHGAIYAVMKTEGDLHEKLRGWINKTIIIFVVCYALLTITTLTFVPHMTTHFKQHPWFFIIAILNMLAIANIPREINKGSDFRAFLSSSASIAALMTLFAIGVFPNLVYSNLNPEYSLTLYNAASSQKTLKTMLIIAIIGIPVILAYTTSIYWIFRGKVKLDSTSY